MLQSSDFTQIQYQILVNKKPLKLFLKKEAGVSESKQIANYWDVDNFAPFYSLKISQTEKQVYNFKPLIHIP